MTQEPHTPCSTLKEKHRRRFTCQQQQSAFRNASGSANESANDCDTKGLQKSACRERGVHSKLACCPSPRKRRRGSLQGADKLDHLPATLANPKGQNSPCCCSTYSGHLVPSAVPRGEQELAHCRLGRLPYHHHRVAAAAAPQSCTRVVRPGWPAYHMPALMAAPPYLQSGTRPRYCARRALQALKHARRAIWHQRPCEFEGGSANPSFG
mmetsp:Transcript_149618/g.417048  ORF Transcript_149618/g.417048 Transcript_149618/m.417048 type:complete len:210 (-) Transcript_149618:62-691(-)